MNKKKRKENKTDTSLAKQKHHLHMSWNNHIIILGLAKVCDPLQEKEKKN